MTTRFFLLKLCEIYFSKNSLIFSLKTIDKFDFLYYTINNY